MRATLFIFLGMVLLSAVPAGAQNRQDKACSFKYGKAYTEEECEARYAPLIAHTGLKKGDVVADIGAASGCTEGAMALFTDSISFYSQDIRKDCLKEFGRMKAYYSALRKGKQTNTFHYVLGTSRATQLPDSAFDQVFIINSLHEFSYVSDMLRDIYRKLKPGGRLVIDERISQPGQPLILPGCFVTAYTSAEILELLETHGFYLTGQMYPDSVDNVLVFEKNRKISAAYLARKKALDPFLDVLDALDSAAFVADSVAMASFEDSLVSRFPEIQAVYRSFELWISNLGYGYIDQKNYQAAVAVLAMNTRLHPRSSNAYDSLADAYLAWGKQALAKTCYEKAIALNPACIGSKAKLRRLESGPGSAQ